MDQNNQIRYAEYVKEVADHPNYESALAAAGSALAVTARSVARLRLTPTHSSPAFAAERVLTRAVESPLVRGGLTIVAGVLTGNCWASCASR